MGANTRSPKLDALDKGIIELLRRDPRITNRDAAEALGVSELTIANRMRSLAEHRVILVTAQEDIRALGFDLLVLVDIFVGGRPTELVANDLGKINQVATVSIMMTAPEIIIEVLARDRNELARILEEEVALVPGVAALESDVILHVVKFVSEYADFDPHV